VKAAWRKLHPAGRRSRWELDQAVLRDIEEAIEVDVDANVVGTWLLYLSVAFSLWSAWVYIRDFFRAVYSAGGTGPGDGRGP
jgi:hypothetical protein